MTLAIEDVTVTFGGVEALRDVSFTVPTGQTCGLIGPNGAGKTTLFDVISGLRRPTHGRIRLSGRDVTTHSAVRRSRGGIRRTFQRPRVFGQLSVADNVLAALEWRGGGGGLVADLVGWPARRTAERHRRDRVDEVLAVCGLSEVCDRPAATLPIGPRRLVELARAIVDRPAVVLLDEPTSGLDDEGAERIGAVVAALETTCLVVEHDMSFVMERCDRLVVLNVGRVLSDGAPATIRDDPAVRAAYLG